MDLLSSGGGCDEVEPYDRGTAPNPPKHHVDASSRIENGGFTALKTLSDVIIGFWPQMLRREERRAISNPLLSANHRGAPVVNK